MPFRKVFCPECGQQTQVNDSKPFSFCQECGSKIVLQQQKTIPAQQTVQPVQKEDATISANPNDDIEKRLEEVAFYYQLSQEKNEAAHLNEEPVYYLKAQDILNMLSSQYPQEYRVWWELCKPVDYATPETTVDIENRHSINEAYFEKALDAADIATKRVLINSHDRYIMRKKRRLEEYARKKQEEEAAERAEEERRRQEALAAAEKQRLEEQEEAKRREQEALAAAEKQRLKEQEEAKRREQEALRQQEQEAAEEEKQRQQQQAQQDKMVADSAPLWVELADKNYANIDGKHFILPQANNQSVIGIFRNVSNMLYLLAYRIDHAKGNLVYQEQNMTVKFDNNGHVLKYDNTPVKVQLPNAVAVLRVMSNGNGGFSVCNTSLVKDAAYIKNIMQIAKKPLLAKKMFM